MKGSPLEFFKGRPGAPMMKGVTPEFVKGGPPGKGMLPSAFYPGIGMGQMFGQGAKRDAQGAAERAAQGAAERAAEAVVLAPAGRLCRNLPPNTQKKIISSSLQHIFPPRTLLQRKLSLFGNSFASQ